MNHQLPGLTMEKFLLWFFCMRLTTGEQADGAIPEFEIAPNAFQIVVNDWECYRAEIELPLTTYNKETHGEFLKYAEEAYSFLNMALVGETSMYLNVAIKKIEKKEVACA